MGDNDDLIIPYYAYYIASVSSIITSILLYFLISKQESNYSKFIKYICLSESIFIFSEFLLIFVDMDKLEKYRKEILKLDFLDIFH